MAPPCGQDGRSRLEGIKEVHPHPNTHAQSNRKEYAACRTTDTLMAAITTGCEPENCHVITPLTSSMIACSGAVCSGNWEARQKSILRATRVPVRAHSRENGMRRCLLGGSTGIQQRAAAAAMPGSDRGKDDVIHRATLLEVLQGLGKAKYRNILFCGIASPKLSKAGKDEPR